MSKNFVVKSIGNHRYRIFSTVKYNAYDTTELRFFINTICQWCKKTFGNDYMTWNITNDVFSFNEKDCIETPDKNQELRFKITWCL